MPLFHQDVAWEQQQQAGKDELSFELLFVRNNLNSIGPSFRPL